MGKARRERRLQAQLKAYKELCKDLPIDESLGVVDPTQLELDFAAVAQPSVQVVVDHSDDVPLLVERRAVETAYQGASYEEANWARLSPAFRLAHNRLRQMRGLEPIPPPAIDLYRPPLIRKADANELAALDREAGVAKAQFLGQQRHMAPGHEGFTINGEPVKF